MPFIGIGVGAVNVAVKLYDERQTIDKAATFDGSGWGFAYQANVGVAYEIVDAVALTLGYKFFGTLETEVTDAGANADDDDGRHVRQAEPAGAPRRAGRPLQVLGVPGPHERESQAGFPYWGAGLLSLRPGGAAAHHWQVLGDPT